MNAYRGHDFGKEVAFALSNNETKMGQAVAGTDHVRTCINILLACNFRPLHKF